MQKVQVSLVDDIDGSPAYITVPFMVNGTHYEIELSETNHKAMLSGLAKFTEHARHVGRYARARLAPDAKPVTVPRTAGERPGRPESPQAGKQTDAVAERGRIRAWATEHGHPVAERGRLPGKIVALYYESNRTGD